MKGTLKKTEQGWTIRYFDTGKAHDIMYCGESLPLHPDNETYCLDADQGKEVQFYMTASPMGFITYAKLIGSEARKQTLAYLVSQAQELNLGYEPEWDEFFVESEQVLNFELPLRYKNWLKNKYKTPTKI
jgi:hypothetical protein